MKETAKELNFFCLKLKEHIKFIMFFNTNKLTFASSCFYNSTFDCLNYLHKGILSCIKLSYFLSNVQFFHLCIFFTMNNEDKICIRLSRKVATSISMILDFMAHVILEHPIPFRVSPYTTVYLESSVH